jgi:transposase
VSTKRPRSFTRDFKLSALKRMAETESVQGLAEELGIDRGQLYRWRRALVVGGEAGLRRKGRPSGLERAEAALTLAEAVAAEAVAAEAVAVGTAAPSAAPAQRRIAELERKIGEQQVALDFFRAALRHVKAHRPSSGAPGGTGSTP